MKLSKFILVILMATFISVLYVYQQTEIFRLAYSGQKKINRLDELLDMNSVIRYNIDRSASLTRIGNKIFQGTDFQMPDNYQFVKIGVPLEKAKTYAGVAKRENLFSRVFSIKRQAEAQTINP